MSDPAGIPALVDAVRHLHDCAAKHVETVHLVEKAPTGETVWSGDVEVFELIGHAKAKRAYAWSEATTGKKRLFSTSFVRAGSPSAKGVPSRASKRLTGAFKSGHYPLVRLRHPAGSINRRRRRSLRRRRSSWPDLTDGLLVVGIPSVALVCRARAATNGAIGAPPPSATAEETDARCCARNAYP